MRIRAGIPLDRFACEFGVCARNIRIACGTLDAAGPGRIVERVYRTSGDVTTVGGADPCRTVRQRASAIEVVLAGDVFGRQLPRDQQSTNNRQYGLGRRCRGRRQWQKANSLRRKRSLSATVVASQSVHSEIGAQCVLARPSSKLVKPFCTPLMPLMRGTKRIGCLAVHQGDSPITVSDRA